jgi:hypothetical protein
VLLVAGSTLLHLLGMQYPHGSSKHKQAGNNKTHHDPKNKK